MNATHHTDQGKNQMTNNSEPAFPSAVAVGAAGDVYQGQYFGMSLRDYFAAQCLEEARYRAVNTKEYELNALFGSRTGLRREELIAAYAYQQADAMIKAREASL